MEPTGEYLMRKRGGRSIWVSSSLNVDSEKALMEEPDQILSLPECQLIKDQKKITVGRISLKLRGEIRGVYVKRYNAFSLRYRLVSLVVLSGAVRSLRGALLLLNSGFSTVRPIAAVEYRTMGMLRKSVFVSEEIQGGKTVDDYWREALMAMRGSAGFVRRTAFLKRLGELFRSLHVRGVYHNDLKDANILVTRYETGGEETFHLLDLEGIRRFDSLNRRRRIKNLVQLNRTMGRLLSAGQRLRCLRAYLGSSYLDRSERRKWIVDIEEESRRRNLRSLRRS
jgi:tRNA A-37 threonylcarbamoyl transferase component Bud32